MKWTKEQQQVIDLRDCNILVSAAAGSGKTAVLIERILSRILDPVNPVNVDEFLIVTFTKAAAAQMKERLVKALEKALQDDPENEHLQRQLMLVPMAQISTIHSFCGYVIQNYFHRTGVDPAYRVASESELGMIRADVMAELLEEKYMEAEDGFIDMAIMSQFAKSDAEIEKQILTLYNRAMSDPFPKDFLERMRAFVCVDSLEELKEGQMVWQNAKYVQNMCKGIAKQYEEMKQICEKPLGPFWYVDALETERIQFAQMAEETAYERLGKLLNGVEYVSRLPVKRGAEVDEVLKKAVQDKRKKVKDAVKKIWSEVYASSFEEQLLQLKEMRKVAEPFIDLTLEFMDKYQQKKREKSIVDFNDLEQMSLEILVEKDEEGRVVPTEAAEELSQQFAEIMIDEYQDSNLVQDYLLGSVSNGKNLFMVGDIKQSIYRFRMARPELFLSKLTNYSEEEGARERVIFLSKNFRSRDVILEGTNAVFEQIMQPELGGVAYDEDAKLQLGANYPETNLTHAEDIDVYAIDGKDDGTYEGKIIAQKIREYTGECNPIYVLEEEEYRKAEYRDIVILVRKNKGVNEAIYNVLTAEGIPVYMENKSGFFDTKEISLMVHLLQVVDNPRQDIPLVAVLRSPAFDFSDDELAMIRGKDKKRNYYDSLRAYDREDELQEKIQRFLATLQKLRSRMSYVTVADILQEIYDETHIDQILMSMKNGIQRKANLELLMERAREFDRTSYQGLYQFVRYLSGIKKRQEEMGEANLLGDGENVVRIMTIHKSKGLEFPICFMAGMGRSPRGSKTTPFLVINPDTGIATRIVDNQRGRAWKNVFLNSLQRMNVLDDLGEELRVLYVAMTRAKEKLILTGTAKPEWVMGKTDYFSLLEGDSYYQWMLPVMNQHPLFRVYWEHAEGLQEAEQKRQAEVLVDEVMLNNFDTTFTYDEEVKELLTFMEKYEEEKEPEEVPTKLSVSEIKRRSMEEHDDEGFTVLDVEALENQSPVPAFAREETDENEALAGANYGTIWHQAMAGLDFTKMKSQEDIESGLESMVQSGRMRREDLGVIRVSKLQQFFDSNLGKEMCQAAAEGRLYREQPFVIGVPAKDVLPDTEDESTVLVQGIIDGFYETDAGIVLMDYKTDRVEPGKEEVLVERYGKQMELYAKALENITGQSVLRRVLYSFSQNKEIEC